MKTLRLVADRSGERLDSFIVRRQPELSRNRIRHLIDDGLGALVENFAVPPQSRQVLPPNALGR